MGSRRRLRARPGRRRPLRGRELQGPRLPHPHPQRRDGRRAPPARSAGRLIAVARRADESRRLAGRASRPRRRVPGRALCSTTGRRRCAGGRPRPVATVVRRSGRHVIRTDPAAGHQPPSVWRSGASRCRRTASRSTCGRPAVDGARRPVVVFIHGGGVVAGFGSAPLFDGGRLARRGDLVVVTINFRLGALGSLFAPERLGDDGDPADEPRAPRPAHGVALGPRRDRRVRR